MCVYISNVLSLSTFPQATWKYLAIEELESPSDIPELYFDWLVSAIDDQSTADIFTKILGRPIECNNKSYIMDPFDRLIVGEYSGPKLPEGTTELPDGASIRWYVIYYMFATND